MNEEQFKDIARFEYLLDCFDVNEDGMWVCDCALPINPRGVRAAIDEAIAERDDDSTVSDSSHE